MSNNQSKHSLRHVVAVSNNKGGAGKTSTVLNLAAAITRHGEGYRVLVIDCDPQRNLSHFLKWNDELELNGKPTLYTALCNEHQGLPVYYASDGIYFTPASVNLNGIDALLSLRPNPSKALREVLQRPFDDHTDVPIISDDDDDTPTPPSEPLNTTSLKEAFDFIFIDTQPAMSRMTYNALYAADGYIIPTELEEASVTGMANIGVAARKVSDDTGKLQCHGILITKVDERLRSAHTYEKVVRGYRETFNTAIRRSKDVIESQALHEDVFVGYDKGRAAHDYAALADEYLEKFG